MKKTMSLFLAIITILTISCTTAFATEVDFDEATLRDEGTSLLTKLLERQFDANKTGEHIDTSDILANMPGTELYRQYLYWYSGKCNAAQEYWTDYDYSLDFAFIDGDSIVFKADLSYGRTCSKYHSEAHGFEYRIQLIQQDNKFLISDIDTEEINFFNFKIRLSPGVEDVAVLTSDSISTVSENTLDAMIAGYAEMKNAMTSMVIDSADIVDMEEEHETYLEAVDAGTIAEPIATSFSYDRERGRRYADLYYTKGGLNSCFKDFGGEGGDCTNWVSQCVWAGYGGWADGDSVATMTQNINDRKRMQSSSNLANWFGHKIGAGDAWANVSDFWDLVTSNPSIGPKGTGHYDEKKWSTSGMKSTEIVTGQVLQVRKGNSGKYEHSVFVSGGTNDSFANIKITQHSPYNRIMLDELIDSWGGSTSCYMRQLKFSSANFNS